MKACSFGLCASMRDSNASTMSPGDIRRAAFGGGGGGAGRKFGSGLEKGIATPERVFRDFSAPQNPRGRACPGHPRFELVWRGGDEDVVPGTRPGTGYWPYCG